MSTLFPFLSSPPLSPRPPPLRLALRFLAFPDIEVDLYNLETITVADLKLLLRRQLCVRAATPINTSTPSSSFAPTSKTAQEVFRRRLRIIYSGRILPDDTYLGAVLRPIPPPPRTGASNSNYDSNSSSVAATPRSSTPQRLHSANDSGVPLELLELPSDVADDHVPRAVVSCSVGDVMSDFDLERELAPMDETIASLRSSGSREGQASQGRLILFGSGRYRSDSTVTGTGSLSAEAEQAQPKSQAQPQLTSQQQQRQQQQHQVSLTRQNPIISSPVPRGFERLLAAGFTAAEVNQLRLQFRSVQSARFTPDEMPSPEALRTMEENWLDNNQSGGRSGSSAAHRRPSGQGWLWGWGTDNNQSTINTDENDAADARAVAAAVTDDDFGMAGLLDVMVRAMMIGFVWPLASVCWLSREQGLWSRKWRLFVSFGVGLSFMIGTVRALAGEG